MKMALAVALGAPRFRRTTRALLAAMATAIVIALVIVR